MSFLYLYTMKLNIIIFLSIFIISYRSESAKTVQEKELLKTAIEVAKHQALGGLVTIVGTKKFHFMSDTKWFLKQGFLEV